MKANEGYRDQESREKTRGPCGREVSAIEAGMRFALWTLGRRREPTLEEVQSKFHVSRATAYRYIGRWRDVNGLPSMRDTQWTQL